MPKFISERDVAFFKGIAREVVDVVIQNAIVLFKVNLNETKSICMVNLLIRLGILAYNYMH